jgi:hypothetical protein
MVFRVPTAESPGKTPRHCIGEWRVDTGIVPWVRVLECVTSDERGNRSRKRHVSCQIFINYGCLSVRSLVKLCCSSDLCFDPTLLLSAFTLFIKSGAAPHNHHSSLLLQINLQFPADLPKVSATSTGSVQRRVNSVQVKSPLQTVKPR